MRDIFCQALLLAVNASRVAGKTVRQERIVRIARSMLCIGWLMAADAQAATDPYAYDQIDLLAGIASHRPVDGLDYYDGNGVLSAGMRYTHAGGFYAAAQVLHGSGDEVQMPATAISNLETATGWAWFVGEHGLSMEIQDYRLWSALDNVDYQALAVNYRQGGFNIELGFERDKPLYYFPLNRYFRYHTRRAAVAYRIDTGKQAALQFSLGSKEIDRINIRYEYAAARFDWHWQGLDWSLAYTVASDDIDTFYSSSADHETVTLGVAVKFSFDHVLRQ